jgi:hypothetical protein
MRRAFKKKPRDSARVELLEILIIAIIVCVIFPVCWLGEKIAIGPERNELGNFFAGIFAIGGSLVAVSAALFGAWTFF